MNDLEKRIQEVIGEVHMASFATVTEDGKPWVRYVMAKADEEMTIRFATFLGARKVAQIRSLPEVHITAGVSDPEHWNRYVQVQGRAEIVNDEASRHAFWHPMLGKIFSGADDPNYSIVVVTPYRIELNTIGTLEPEVWEA